MSEALADYNFRVLERERAGIVDLPASHTRSPQPWPPAHREAYPRLIVLPAVGIHEDARRHMREAHARVYRMEEEKIKILSDIETLIREEKSLEEITGRDLILHMINGFRQRIKMPSVSRRLNEDKRKYKSRRLRKAKGELKALVERLFARIFIARNVRVDLNAMFEELDGAPEIKQVRRDDLHNRMNDIVRIQDDNFSRAFERVRKATYGDDEYLDY